MHEKAARARSECAIVRPVLALTEGAGEGATWPQAFAVSGWRSLTEQAASGTKTLQGVPGPRRIPGDGELPEV